jgi:predicted nucleotidyltransferase
MLTFGLPLATCSTIRRILADEPAVEKAVIFGSRAKGTQRPGSDIDLTLVGPGLSLATLGHIAAQLDESPIPYQVDLSVFDLIEHPGLREHIERVGQVFYQKQIEGNQAHPANP